MTLVAAWIRRTPGAEELVIASDSRLTGGITLSHAPKLFPLDRNDAVLAYCGPTVVAYPILLQIKASLDAHDETRNRVIDIVDLKAHIEKTIERLRFQISDMPTNDETDKGFKFLLAGYSWKFSKFRAWMFRFDNTTRDFNAHSVFTSGHSFTFMSDVSKNEVLARNLLIKNISKNAGKIGRRLDWEPLDVLLSFIRDETINDIGGPPQIIKVYRHSNLLPINVLWPELRQLSGLSCLEYQINHLGRPILGYEKTRLLTLDPDSGELIEPWKIRAYTKERNERAFQHQLAKRLVALLAWKRKCKNTQVIINAMLQQGAAFNEVQAVMNCTL